MEWTSEAAVPIDLLFLAYARWSAAHGEPLLAEAQVLTWLEQRGARITTAPLSRITQVEGVRLVD